MSDRGRPRRVAVAGWPGGAILPIMYDLEDDEDDDRELSEEEMDEVEDAYWNTVTSDFTADDF